MSSSSKTNSKAKKGKDKEILKEKKEDIEIKENEADLEAKKEETLTNEQIEMNARAEAEELETERQLALEAEAAEVAAAAIMEETNKSQEVIEEQIEQVKKGINEKKSDNNTSVDNNNNNENNDTNSNQQVNSTGDPPQAEDGGSQSSGFREFHYHPGGHYHPGAYSDILNPAYIRYVNHSLGGLRFLGGLRTLMWVGEDEPPRRIVAWSCCSNQEKSANGCKLREDSPPRYHPGMFSCFCHDCKAQINGFETSRCAEPCQGNWAQRAPNTFSMLEKNWEKDDDQIEFVALQTLESIFFKSEWPKRSACKRNWFEWTCCGSPVRSSDGCQPVILPGNKEYDTTTIRL